MMANGGRSDELASPKSLSFGYPVRGEGPRGRNLGNRDAGRMISPAIRRTMQVIDSVDFSAHGGVSEYRGPGIKFHATSRISNKKGTP
jgi:hypothetical protein